MLKQATFIVDTTSPVMPQKWELEKWGENVEGWAVAEHRPLGTGIAEVAFRNSEMYINGQQVIVCGQEEYGTITLDQFHEGLSGQVVLPDAILELLIREQDNEEVHQFLQRFLNVGYYYPGFWGTVYQISFHGRDLIRIRYLRYSGDRWIADKSDYDPTWHLSIGLPIHIWDHSPALVLASSDGVAECILLERYRRYEEKQVLYRAHHGGLAARIKGSA